MRYFLSIILTFTFFSLFGQTTPNVYEKAFEEIHGMLKDEKPMSFKRAVFLIENAWYQDTLTYKEFDENIRFLSDISKQLLTQNQESFDIILLKNWCIYSVMKDTLISSEAIENGVILKAKMPFHYDFEDYEGKQDWSKMFVSKLIETRTGNCHSLPYLYKILADEIGTTAHIALAPNHSYIKQRTETTGWYNTELTNNAFPIDAWLMASGYITLEAIQNGVYLRALSDKEMITLCLIDLAHGYQRQGGTDTDFILKCADTALKYHPNFINALMLKAETLKSIFEQSVTYNEEDYSISANNIAKNQELFNEMQDIYLHIFDLGYRTMPDDMYLRWLSTVNEAKYQNKKLNNFNVQPSLIQKY